MAFRTRLQFKNGKRERKTVSNSAVGLTAASYTISHNGGSGINLLANDKQADGAIIQVVSANGLTWTCDGTTPVAGSVGFIANQEDFITLETNAQVRQFKAIRTGASDSAIEVAYLWGN
jgi:hypothetical protein